MDPVTAMLRKVTIERRPDGRFDMLREHDGEDQDGKGKRGGGDRWTCASLDEAWVILSSAYASDGTPHPSDKPRTSVTEVCAYEAGYIDGKNAVLADVQGVIDEHDEETLTKAEVVARVRDMALSG